MYSFEVGGTAHEHGIFIEEPYEDNFNWRETLDSRRTKIDKYFERYGKMIYTYDFGDNWVHNIIVEKVINKGENLEKAICIKAKMASLPEDCGGVWGYEELLEDISDSGNDNYEEQMEWLGEEFEKDRTKVEIEKINYLLGKL